MIQSDMENLSSKGTNCCIKVSRDAGSEVSDSLHFLFCLSEEKLQLWILPYNGFLTLSDDTLQGTAK